MNDKMQKDNLNPDFNTVLNIPKWGFAEMTGYEPKTTLWQDFSIADRFGLDAIRDTYNRAKDYVGGDPELMAELTLVLNHKIWQWYETKEGIARLYNDLWMEHDGEAYDSLDEEGRSTYFHIVD